MIVDIIVAVLSVAAIITLLWIYKFSRRLIAAVFIFFILFAGSIFLELIYAPYFLSFFGISVVFILLFTNSRQEMQNILYHKKRTTQTKETISDINIRLAEKLAKAVENLSANKTGALISIERKDKMEQYMITSGVAIEATLTPELINTIFCNKTPLHDGAVIIKGEIIAAAAVFYQPTRKPLNGKFGSRHRAAIGISEICDAITIVVSEETGRVSFAIRGELIMCSVSNFYTKLLEYLNS